MPPRRSRARQSHPVAAVGLAGDKRRRVNLPTGGLDHGADGSSRIPLGLMVVGGIAFAQVITLFLTPALFLYLEVVQNHFKPRTDLE